MQMDWTTFLLEILNFLVLVWILKRFLYKPVLDVLDTRAAGVRAQVQQAEQARKEADALKQQYEARCDEWSHEREEKRAALVQELAKERTTRLNELQQTISDERTRIAAREQALSASREQALLRQTEEKATANVATMLTRLADAALTVRIVGMLVEDLAALGQEKCAELKRAAERVGKNESMEIAAAHTLDDATSRKVTQAILQVTGREIPCRITLMPELIAGLRITLGECVLHANLADELAYFRREKKYG
jgi:F-type H+-transporting ATPase subunit b